MQAMQRASASSNTEEARDALIRRFELQPHPEGGYYRETYRAQQRVSRESSASSGARDYAASTAIYYLLCDGAHSAWHRIRSDEIWHFYAGAALNVYVLNEDGSVTTHRLGDALVDHDAAFQAVVEAGAWFAAECADPATYALVGCTVAPGFEFSEFELADVDALLARYPAHRELIARLGPIKPSGS
ncbi:cupin domain-containing protein [Paraburkholderia phosphatilytica]|uniref:cupin domain-containing protein n=1 Tax=Paraburkholderia phosphatilytica TaxID=2282883 RepID=UPI001F0CBF75|nr:cupin domain-containing protein [Paraburkholderia phosphatilytica]